MRIYTRTGDEGATALFGGGRVGKDHPRVEAYGDVDELNAVLGMARAAEMMPRIDEVLVPIQRDLFAIGALLATPDHEKMREKVLEEAKRVFKPEFLNRISDIIFFRPLDKNDLTKIVELELSNFSKRLLERKITLEFTPESKQLLIEKGYDEKYGARPLRRAVEHYLEDPLAEALLKGEVKDGEPCVVVREGDKLIFKQKTPAADTGVAP